MKNKLKLLTLVFFSISATSQNLKILKDSVFVDSSFFVLEELKINLNNEKANNKIYAVTQNAYEIFDEPFVGKPEIRIKMKKDTISDRILKKTLRESNSGFEHYEIYYDKNNIINLSISIQSYGSPWEGIEYYCFDLNNGKRIELDLFVNRQALLEKCRTKLKDQSINILLKQNHLSSYKIITDKNKHILGMEFSIFETEVYRNSGYQEFIIHFDWSEIKEYISPVFKNRFL